MKIIFNADDFGYTKSVTDGIIHACKNGVVKSTTALVNTPYLEYSHQEAKTCPFLGVGVHLNLTIGKALTNNLTLSDDQGNFFYPRELLEKDLDLEEVYREFKAQIERFIAVFEKMPSHLDSHHGMHDFKENLSVTMRLAQEYGLPVRRYGNYRFVGGFFDDSVTVDALIELIESHAGSDLEIMTHPGACDLELFLSSSYSWQRVREMAVLCDGRLQGYLDDMEIEVTNYLED